MNEQKAFEKAKKRTEEEYEGLLYVPDLNNFFNDWEEIIEHCDVVAECEYPEYAWCELRVCLQKRPILELLEEELEEEFYEGATDWLADLCKEAIAKINQHLEEFYGQVESADFYTSKPDYKHCVLLPERFKK